MFIFEIEVGRGKEWTQKCKKKLTGLVVIHVFYGRKILCILLVFLRILLLRQKI